MLGVILIMIQCGLTCKCGIQRHVIICGGTVSASDLNRHKTFDLTHQSGEHFGHTVNVLLLVCTVFDLP